MNTCVGKEVEEKVLSSKHGEIFLLENVRFHPEEEGYVVNHETKKKKKVSIK